ncbi:MAG: TIGR00730 family Rossman fold protein [Candidatus Marinimicrobia bacterium]|jgi:hypothetical protein|nr:TIGR00730 family Rossman fold protein [Candidatus Neomarinimicrobiota bacterium]
MTDKQKNKPFHLNPDFLKSPDARSIRIAAEYLGPQLRFSRNHIEDTIVFFGSARIKSPKDAKQDLKNRSKKIRPEKKKELERNLSMSKFYEDARLLAKQLTKWSKKLKNSKHRYIITSGGGPGIMEAANRGASEAKGLAIGLNITVPNEQSGNKWITPDLDIEFHYFFMRKFWMSYLAKALVAFPGGFGTMDELFEILTLIQTKKIKKTIPIVLYGKEFWENIVNWDYLVKIGTISKKDLNLFCICDTVDDAYNYLTDKITGTHTGPNF